MTRRRVAFLLLAFTAGILAGLALLVVLQRQHGPGWWPWAVGIIIMVVVVVAGLGWIVTRPHHPQ